MDPKIESQSLDISILKQNIGRKKMNTERREELIYYSIIAIITVIIVIIINIIIVTMKGQTGTRTQGEI